MIRTQPIGSVNFAIRENLKASEAQAAFKPRSSTGARSRELTSRDETENIGGSAKPAKP